MAATRSHCSENDIVLCSDKSKCVWIPARPRVPRAFLRSVPPDVVRVFAGGRSWETRRHVGAAAPPPPAAPDVSLPLVPAVRILGVFFDGDLRFATHTAILSARPRRRVALLRRLSSNSWGCGSTILLATYKALVQNCLAHGIVGWGSFVPEEVFRRLNVEVVHPGLRLACGVGRWCRIEALYALSGCMSVQSLYAYRCGKLFDHVSRTRGNDAAASVLPLCPQSPAAGVATSTLGVGRVLQLCCTFPSLPVRASEDARLVWSEAREPGQAGRSRPLSASRPPAGHDSL